MAISNSFLDALSELHDSNPPAGLSELDTLTRLINGAESSDLIPLKILTSRLLTGSKKPISAQTLRLASEWVQVADISGVFDDPILYEKVLKFANALPATVSTDSDLLAVKLLGCSCIPDGLPPSVITNLSAESTTLREFRERLQMFNASMRPFVSHRTLDQ